MLSGITHSFPWLFRTLGHITTRYSPFRRCPSSKASFKTLLARLACLIHAANVHSEPESNPSIGYMHQLLADGSGEAKEPFEVLEVNYPPKQTANQYGLVIGSQGRGYKEPRLESHKEVTHQIVKERSVILAICFSVARASSKLFARFFPRFSRFRRTVSHGRLVILAIGRRPSTAFV